MSRIYIFDTTLRDGEQTPGVSLNVQEKLEIARQLARLNVDVIEAGFPVASPGDFAATAAIAEQIQGPKIAALARATAKDIETAAKALQQAKYPIIHTFVATSPIHMEYKLRKQPAEVLQMVEDAVKGARGFVDDVEFSAEDATRSDLVFLAEVVQTAVNAGATRINIPDTVGYTTPGEFRNLIHYLKNHVAGIDQVQLSVHCHNDLGMAVANSLAALEAGATQVECTINGLGERAGNASLEELVMALSTRQDYFAFRTGIVTEHISRTSRLVSALTGVPVQPNKAIVGANAFAHESGIHQDGFLKAPSTYEIMTPQSIGLHESRLVLGKHSGRHAFREKLKELGYNLTGTEMEQAFQRFIVLADKKKEVSDRDIDALLQEEIVAIPESLTLDYIHISSGNQTVPTATVRLTQGEIGTAEAACGSGPIDAVYKAIDRASGISAKLESYALQAVTGGKDALGEVTVRIRGNGSTFIGRGTSTDIIEASAKAYVHALNKLVYQRSQNPDDEAPCKEEG
ncbi:MAG: 2-isopropylmalate synthase [Firmicutes bacterium]|nr:2-isopropylmalate synthase [Bacillota bacterium]